MEIKNLSYSSINLFMMCPKAWEFRYIKKIKTPKGAALVFGIAMHNAIENYLAMRTGDVNATANVPTDKDQPSLIEIWDHEWSRILVRESDIVYNEGDNADLSRDTGIRMLQEKEVAAEINMVKVLTGVPFDTWKGPRTGPMIESRLVSRVPGVNIPVIGIVDVMCEDYVPLDVKTASRMWSRGQEHGEIQADFYLAALNQTGWQGNDEFKFRYLIITKAKKPRASLRETTRTIGQVLWVLGLVKENWDAMQTGQFPPRALGWKCSPKFCDYWHLCRGK